MKTSITKILGIIMLVCAVVACKSKDDVIPNAEITSFGFYAADNDKVLDKDYVGVISESSITITLPGEVVKTSLVARFTTTENDVVTVNNVPQTSGSTSNDFTVAVSYTVTDGAGKTEYTVTVADDGTQYVWSEVNTFSKATALTESVMKLNPATNQPYMAYFEATAAAANRRASVVKLDGTSWSQVGSESISAGQPSKLDIAFNSAGKPYIVYCDKTQNDKTTVMSYESPDWALVGPAGLTDTLSGEVTLAFDASNRPIVFNRYSQPAGTKVKYAVVVTTYNGSSWVKSDITGRPSDAVSGGLISAKSANGNIYVNIQGDSQKGYPICVYKYNGTAWSTLADNMITTADNSVVAAGNAVIETDAAGNVYLAYYEATPKATGTYDLTVKKYSVATASWAQIGGVIHASTSLPKIPSLAISPTGKVYVMYINSDKCPAVVALGSDNVWSAPMVLKTVTTGDRVSIAFTSYGTAYASFYDSASAARILYLYKYAPENN